MSLAQASFRNERQFTPALARSILTNSILTNPILTNPILTRSSKTSVRLYLCRDRLDTVPAVLPPHSLVVAGARARGWLSPEKRLARRLKRAGHQVFVTEGE